MATLTIRNFDDDLSRELHRRAAERGVSIEQEAQSILARELMPASHVVEEVSLEKLLALGRKPEKPFDQKKITDELWSYIEEQ